MKRKRLNRLSPCRYSPVHSRAGLRATDPRRFDDGADEEDMAGGIDGADEFAIHGEQCRGKPWASRGPHIPAADGKPVREISFSGEHIGDLLLPSGQRRDGKAPACGDEIDHAAAGVDGDHQKRRLGAERHEGCDRASDAFSGMRGRCHGHREGEARHGVLEFTRRDRRRAGGFQRNMRVIDHTAIDQPEIMRHAVPG